MLGESHPASIQYHCKPGLGLGVHALVLGHNYTARIYLIIHHASIYRWAAGKEDGLEHEMQVKFLEEGKAHTMLKAYIQYLLNRRNPYTEIHYK